MVVVDEEQFRSLPETIATARAYHAQALGDVPATIKYTRRALDLLPEGDYLRRGQATTLLGLALGERRPRGRLPVLYRFHGDYAHSRRHR
jgi:LuxR family maltose regulon positive regulatory protein